MNPQLLKKIDATIGSMLVQLFPRPVLTGPSCSISRLLMIRPGGIGDAVLLIPVINRLRQLLPSVQIDVLAEKRNRGAFALCPAVDQTLCYDRPQDLRTVLGRKYDVVVDTEQWHRLSAVVARMVRSRMKIGYGTNERKRMFTHAVDYSHDNYEIFSFFDLLKPLEIDPPKEISSPFLTISEVDRLVASDWLRSLVDAPVAVIFPGASIPERCWGDENFRQLALRLMDEGVQVVVVGGPEDMAAGEAITIGSRGLNLAGKTSLAETAALIQLSCLLISGDSGVLHIAVGLNVPTVSLFGPGIAAKWAPRGGAHVVINKRLPCSPCTRYGYTPECKIGACCISEISVDEVFDAAQTQLSRVTQGG